MGVVPHSFYEEDAWPKVPVQVTDGLRRYAVMGEEEFCRRNSELAKVLFELYASWENREYAGWAGEPDSINWQERIAPENRVYDCLFIEPEVDVNINSESFEEKRPVTLYTREGYWLRIRGTLWLQLWEPGQMSDELREAAFVTWALCYAERVHRKFEHAQEELERAQKGMEDLPLAREMTSTRLPEFLARPKKLDNKWY